MIDDVDKYVSALVCLCYRTKPIPVICIRLIVHIVYRWAWLYKYLSVIDDHKTDNHNTKRHSAIRLANVHRPYTRVHNNMLMPRMPKLTLDLLKNTFSCCCVFYYFFSNLSKINGVGGLVTEASCCTVPFQMKMFSYVFCQRTPPAALV